MKSLVLVSTVCGCLAAAAFPQRPYGTTIHHAARVRLSPAEHRIDVVDRVRVPLVTTHTSLPTFALHAGLTVTGWSDCVRLEVLTTENGAERRAFQGEDFAGSEVPVRRYRVHVRDREALDRGGFEVTYGGAIHHPLIEEEQEYARSFSRSPGIIDEQGVVLSASSFWLPTFDEETLTTFRLDVSLPEGWDAVSQGERVEHRVADGRRLTAWDCAHPMDDVYLIAARFTESSRPAGAATAYAFLREPDPNLAAKYLETTAQYLEMYRKLIGPYPYAKFALVENFWETGYGMPSFTLLGPKIIRFPFILHSSYPHEILHNWWGNSVFVDYERGNWCEGLTAYLADHLVKEGQGKGAEYRRDALKRYRNYVRGGQDMPLRAFRSRHSSASEAVGYGKALFLFHMLRRELGDDLFTKGLQDFYRQYRFQRASFEDLRRVFATVSGRHLEQTFAQWIERSGAPELALGDVHVSALEGGKYSLIAALRQVQAEEPYDLRVPFAVQLEGEAEAHLVTLHLQDRATTFEHVFDARPVRIEVDARFDVFRRLHRSEIPVTIGQIFGAPRVLLVLPAEDPLGASWRVVAEAWSSSGEGADVRVVREDELERLPDDRAVWVLGATNRWARDIEEALLANGVRVGEDEVSFGLERVPAADHAFVVTAAHPADEDSALGWIGAARADALEGLARKLPHYGKYSYLAFQGGEPTNVVKGQWPATGSPLVRDLTETRHPPLVYPKEEPLARLEPVFEPERFEAHVRSLASEAFEGRGVGTQGIERAAEYVAREFRSMGLVPGGDAGTFFQTWQEPNGPQGSPVTLRNVVGVLKGTRAGWERQSVVIGAHYDHLGFGWPDAREGMEGQLHPGADDNASGVAVLLEVARLLASELVPQRTVIFVAFSGEEWGLKGSARYVEAMTTWPAREALAMINLDTVGRLGAQKLTVLGSGTASEWIHIAMGIGFTTGVESTCVPNDPAGSDQVSFVRAGVPAVQLFTGAHADYHRPSDTADQVDVDGLVKVATFLREATVYLSEREAPLTSTLRAGATEPRPAEAGARRASLGTMPDFGFAGPGVKVGKVMPDSPASQAGVQDGDVLLAIDGHAIDTLRAYSERLKTYEPGARVTLRLLRDGKEVTLEAILAAR